jgi:hypothetical protein
MKPDVDIIPVDLVSRMNKTFLCAPGACDKYVSTGFDLLSLALAELTNSST